LPKRVIDGDAVWTSDKLRSVPEEYRAEYTNLLPLALANGVFECDPQKVWRAVYAYNRPSITPETTAKILNAFEAATMLFRWRDETGKTWGYWVGIHKSGRLPPASSIRRKEHVCGPEPPKGLLDTYVTPRDYVRNTKDGSGSGSGTSVSKEQKPRIRSGKRQPEPEGFSDFWEVWPKKRAKKDARIAWGKLRPSEELRQRIIAAVERENQGRQWKDGVIPHAATWLNGERWEDEIPPPGGNTRDKPTLPALAVGRSRPTPEGEAILEKYGVH